MQRSCGLARSMASAFARLALSGASSDARTASNYTPFINSARNVHCTQLVCRSLRDLHRTGSKFAMLDSDQMTGTVGADSFFAVNTAEMDRSLPSADTLKQLFNGVPYDELPIVYIKATRNNTILHCFDHKHIPFLYTSCRLEGFKHARKKTTIAGQTTGVALGQKLLRRGVRTVRVVVRGIGPGRMSSVKGMTTTGVQVVSISDRTKLPELGKRPRKIRRV